MRTEAHLRQQLVADMSKKFGDLRTVRVTLRTLRHFLANWMYRNGAIGIRRFHVSRRRRDGQITILFHGTGGAPLPAELWARAVR